MLFLSNNFDIPLRTSTPAISSSDSPFLWWLEPLLLFIVITLLLLFIAWLLELSALSESESLSSFESLDADDELSSPICVREWIRLLLVIVLWELTSSSGIWDCCCCCCCIIIAPDAFGIDVEADNVFELLLALMLLLLLLLLYTDDGGWLLLAKLSSNKLGMLGNVCCVLFAFHLRMFSFSR